ncbi:MAG: hypothetical protein ABI633_10040 [Burkholderiales bacterium]
MKTSTHSRSVQMLDSVPNKLNSGLLKMRSYGQDKLAYLRRFSVTGSVCPSTRVFGERAAVEVSSAAHLFDRIVVAGIGNGVVAGRILDRCPDAIFVECDEGFAARFRLAHPRAAVVTDRLERLYEDLPELRGCKVLLASFVPTAGRFYSDEAARLFVEICSRGGLIMQMRYVPHQMSTRFFDGMKARGISSTRLFTVVRNLPPVSMYGLLANTALISWRPGGSISV